MVPRRRIVVSTGNVRYAEEVRDPRRRVVQTHLRSPRPIRERFPRKCLVSILRLGAPEQFVIARTRRGIGRDAVIGIVRYGVELVAGGQAEDLAPGLVKVVVCHVGSGVGKSPCSASIGVGGDGEVVRRD